MLLQLETGRGPPGCRQGESGGHAGCCIRPDTHRNISKSRIVVRRSYGTPSLGWCSAVRVRAVDEWIMITPVIVPGQIVPGDSRHTLLSGETERTSIFKLRRYEISASAHCQAAPD